MALEGSHIAQAPPSTSTIHPPIDRYLLGRCLLCLSPHSDYAAFSSSGVLAFCANAGIDMEVVVPFSVSDHYVRPRDATGDRVSITAIRRQEDLAFATLFPRPLRVIWLGLPDAPLRTGYTLVKLRSASPLDVCDRDALAVIADFLRPRLADPVLLLAPLGVGDHIDHRITCLAAVNAAQSAPSTELFFYEDLPYANEYPLDLLDAWIYEFGNALGFHLEPFILRGADLSPFKRRALNCYPSQLTFGTKRAIAQHGKRPAGAATTAERIWHAVQV